MKTGLLIIVLIVLILPIVLACVAQEKTAVPCTSTARTETMLVGPEARCFGSESLVPRPCKDFVAPVTAKELKVIELKRQMAALDKQIQQLENGK